MDNLGFGLYMTVFGMGTVFALLSLLWGVLWLIGRMDRPGAPEVAAPAVAPPAETHAPAPPRPPKVVVDASTGHLTNDQVAAIAIAVITHSEVRRAQGAPEMRTHQPGSHLYASRWVNVGRAYQNRAWRRK